MVITKRVTTVTETIVRLDDKTTSINKKEEIENVETIIDAIESHFDKSNPVTTD